MAVKQTFIRMSEDMDWLAEVHLKIPKDSLWGRSALIYGNEDCPVRVDIFRTWDARWDEAPMATYESDENGNLHLTNGSLK